MEKRRNAYQNWIFFTSLLALNTAIRVNRNIVFSTFHAWVTPLTIPIVALVALFAVRIAVKAGDSIALALKKMHIPAWILFISTIALYIWISNRIVIGG